jgi:acetyl-CoA decarbonylase/synthase complex subunit delta
MPYLVEKNSGKIAEVTLGKGANAVKIGGQTALPYQYYEGDDPNPAIVAIEIFDREPTEWSDTLKDAWGNVLSDPVAWAKKAVDLGAEMIYLRLDSIDPAKGGRSVADCVKTVKDVLGAINVPLGVQGCGLDEHDKPLIAEVAESCKGENLLIGLATTENYATLAAACLANDHTIISCAPLDINICKQTNILIGEMNMPMDRIVIDPTIGGLGYGLEYAYSILERGRIGALQGDKMLSMPLLGFVGDEAWKTKEATASESDFPGWGDKKERGILWEVVTATTLLQSGIDLLIVRHPETMKTVQAHVKLLKAV